MILFLCSIGSSSSFDTSVVAMLSCHWIFHMLSCSILLLIIPLYSFHAALFLSFSDHGCWPYVSLRAFGILIIPRAIRGSLLSVCTLSKYAATPANGGTLPLPRSRLSATAGHRHPSIMLSYICLVSPLLVVPHVVANCCAVSVIISSSIHASTSASSAVVILVLLSSRAMFSLSLIFVVFYYSVFLFWGIVQ